MAKKPPKIDKTGKRSRVAVSAKADAAAINESDLWLYGAGWTTAASLLGTGNRQARARQNIYAKWAMMEADPIVSTAMQLLVTAALGGHETSGQLVYIEAAPQVKGNAKAEGLVEEIATALGPIFDSVAFQVAYLGGIFGDAYARVYADRSGVTGLYIDELVRPQLVQPYERGGRTIGYQVFCGERSTQKLDILQLARLKMPRTQWVPQFGVVEKALRVALQEDDPEQTPVLPAMVGGSLIYAAEDPYDKLTASLLGLVGQRWLDSIDESLLTVNLESMTLAQQQKFVASIKEMLTASKARAEAAVQAGQPVLERTRHIIPIFNEKQVTAVGPINGGQSGRAGTITIDDIVFHARMLAAAIGVDLSMIGFADQMTGGLGEGGFFRTSAHVAERARIIRVSLAAFFDHVVDIHTLRRYGTVFTPAERPWKINYFGSISALEAEKQRTRTDAMNGGMILVQAVQMMKEMGATKEILGDFLTKQMQMDEDQAKLLATIVDQKPPAPDEGGDGP